MVAWYAIPTNVQLRCTVSVAMLMSKPYSLPFFPKSLLLKTPPVLSLLSTFALQSLTLTLNPNPNPNLIPSYGPSLHKGRPQPQHLHRRFQPSEPLNDAKQPDPEEEEAEQGEESCIFDESEFSRVFDIAAIRVPSGECFALESRLRGHLLNWPRIRNIARVPGDEMEEKVADLLNQSGSSAGNDDANALVPLARRVYGKAEEDGDWLSPVLYREKLVKSFNSRGFAKFKNLSKMSRPKKKHKKSRKEEETGGGKMGIRKSAFAMVEVVEDCKQREDLSGLLGEEFKGRMWKGSTRLLLLDERYADRGVDELPQAIKVAVPIL